MPTTSFTPIREFQVDALRVEVHSTRAAMGAAAAAVAADWLRELLKRQAGAAVIFAAAPSQDTLLASLGEAGGVAWDRVDGFHMDEYLGIGEDHSASFRRYLRERVADRIPLRRFHFIRGEAEQPLDECERYERLLAEQAMDLCLLGIGENGHLAFNDPPVADFADRRRIKLVALDEGCRRQQVAEGHFPSMEAVPRYAFTLTIPALCAAGRMVCVVPGERKAWAVREALEGPITPRCPASFLRQQPQATLFLDVAAAGELAG